MAAVGWMATCRPEGSPGPAGSPTAGPAPAPGMAPAGITVQTAASVGLVPHHRGYLWA